MIYCDRCDGDTKYAGSDGVKIIYKCVDCGNRLYFPIKKIEQKRKEEEEMLREEMRDKYGK
jgi:tRNA(Ile2) C34 agmatinyltransferase TiaS